LCLEFSRGQEPSAHYPRYGLDLRATHARTLLPAAMAPVSPGFVLRSSSPRDRVNVDSFLAGSTNSMARIRIRMYAAAVYLLNNVRYTTKQATNSPTLR